MHRHKFKKKKIDICNICMQVKPLSWDHVPPKGGIELTQLQQETVLQKLTSAPENKKFSISQNGVKFRTICKECNENLGVKYDQELNKLVLTIREVIENASTPIKSFKIFAKSDLIIKSIFGHLLAAKVNFENTKIDETLRAYYFNNLEAIKNKLHIYYWLYPYQNFVVLRDVIMPKARGSFKEFGMFSILKYLPIGFVITDFENYENLKEIKFEGDDNKISEFLFDIKIPHPDWPEIVDNGNIMLSGKSIESSVAAFKRNI